jgi:hypothetical protein
MTVVSLGHEAGNQHPTSSTAAIFVISICSICLQLSILYRLAAVFAEEVSRL